MDCFTSYHATCIKTFPFHPRRTSSHFLFFCKACHVVALLLNFLHLVNLLSYIAEIFTNLSIVRMNLLAKNESGGWCGLPMFTGTFFENMHLFFGISQKTCLPNNITVFSQKTCTRLPQHHTKSRLPGPPNTLMSHYLEEKWGYKKGHFKVVLYVGNKLFPSFGKKKFEKEILFLKKKIEKKFLFLEKIYF